MKTITIDGVEYSLTPIKKTEPIILEQNLKFEVYPEDLGDYNWDDANELCEELGDGWRLPTREELNLMYLNSSLIKGFSADYYWSSSEYVNYYAWAQSFSFGTQNSPSKILTYPFRAVRTIK